MAKMFSLTTQAWLQVCCLLGFAFATQSTCNMPSVKAGGTAILTCNFGDDLKKIQVPFAVKRFKDNVTAENLLYCEWDNSTAVYFCPENYPNVEFDKKVGITASVRLPAAKETEGKYMCQRFISSDSGSPCFFRLLPVLSTGQSSDEGFSTSTRIGTIVGIIAVVIILGVAAAVLIHWKRDELRARFCYRRSKPDTVDGAGGEEEAAVPLSSGPIFKGPSPQEHDETSPGAGKYTVTVDGIENGAGDGNKVKVEKRSSKGDPKV